MISKQAANGIELLTIENDHLRVTVAPALGGKIVSVYNKALEKEFLWLNGNIALSAHARGADYDTNFTGGIDELIPNDLVETIDSIDYPDHGELWTSPLSYTLEEDNIILQGTLELSGLSYSRTLKLDTAAPIIQLTYNIKNDASEQRNFLWKLHAAIRIKAGDKLVTAARCGQVVDPDYSRFKNELTAFKWPWVENTDASIIPEKNNTVDFFYLYDIPSGQMAVESDDDHIFGYIYDKKVFPFQWWFASYGAFLDHYTAVLEPCTNMPMSVNEAKKKGQCAALQPGESLITSVQIFAGKKRTIFLT